MPPSDAQKIQTDDKDIAAEATMAIDSSIITQCIKKNNYQIFIHKIIDFYVDMMLKNIDI